MTVETVTWLETSKRMRVDGPETRTGGVPSTVGGLWARHDENPF